MVSGKTKRYWQRLVNRIPTIPLLRETEAKDLGFQECECVDCGEIVSVPDEAADGSGTAWYYDCAKVDQVYEPWMTGGEA